MACHPGQQSYQRDIQGVLRGKCKESCLEKCSLFVRDDENENTVRCEYCGCPSRFHSRVKVEEHVEELVTKKLTTSFDSDKESRENLCENPGENRCQTETPEPRQSNHRVWNPDCYR